ncbi:type II secretion system protein E, partial [Kouleothrix aurantiaca]
MPSEPAGLRAMPAPSAAEPPHTAPPPPSSPPPPSQPAPSSGLSNLVGASSPSIGSGVSEAGGVTEQRLIELSLWIVDRVQGSMGNQTELKRTAESERMLQDRFSNYYRQSGVNLSDAQVKRLYEMVTDELFGFGPIEPLLRDESVSEVMVNGPNVVYVEQRGKVTQTPIRFANDDHVLKVIDRIIRPLGRRIDRKWPMVDARLPDGSRVNAIIPPCSIDGPTVTIRKFSKKKLEVSDLIRFGSMTDQMAEFLRACVVSRLNIVVSGGTGSGKTTLLNVLSNFIPEEDRIVTIEDSAELKLGQDHVVRLEAKPAEIDGSGRVSINDLV